MPSVLWFRRDLRLQDNPALLAAATDGRVVPVFILEPSLVQQSAVRTFALLSTLRALNESLEQRLVLRQGPAATAIPQLVQQVGASSVHASAETEPWGHQRDREVENALARLENPVPLVRTGSPYAVTPGQVLTGAGTAFKVFTPFARAWREHGWRAPAPHPKSVQFVPEVEGIPLPAPEPASVPEAVTQMCFGEQAALETWQQFLDTGLAHYRTARDRMDQPGTSQLSQYLKYGAIHPRTLLADVGQRFTGSGPTPASAQGWMRQLCWREFYADVLWHRPGSQWADYQAGLTGMAYDDPEGDTEAASKLHAWKQGRTGFPVVDAAMRQLLAQGWVHNRARLIAASFLTKDLHLWWPHGAQHFLQHLVDGDVANNNHGWQWVAGTGTDPSPYFRIFNPITQGLRFDPNGDYVRRWVPELAHLPGAAAHEPWKQPRGYSAHYPRPIIEHAEERAEALRRYHTARG